MRPHCEHKLERCLFNVYKRFLTTQRFFYIHGGWSQS